MSVLAAIALLAADLPDPGNPSITALSAGFGAFVGCVLARVRRVPSERFGRLIAETSAVGYGVGMTAWMVSVAIDLL